MCDCGCKNETRIEPWGEHNYVEVYKAPIIFCTCRCHDVWRMVNRGNR